MSRETLKKAFTRQLELLSALLEDLKDNPTTCGGDHITLEFFWIKICLAVHAVSKEATNLCMSFSGPPLPELTECEPILARQEQVCIGLVSAFYSLSLKYGVTLKKRVHSSVTDIVSGVQLLCSSIVQHEFECSAEQLQKTGNVWECCDSFTSLPRDNVGAVYSVVEQYQALVTDAITEMEEAQSGSGEGFEEFGDFAEMMAAPTWSEEDQKLVGPCMGVVKGARACLKKSNATIKKQSSTCSDAHVAALDELSAQLGGLSSGVDEVVSCLYPPVESTTLRSHVKDLAALVTNILAFLKDCPLTTNPDEDWIEFITKATEYNLGKLSQLLPD